MRLRAIKNGFRWRLNLHDTSFNTFDFQHRIVQPQPGNIRFHFHLPPFKIIGLHARPTGRYKIIGLQARPTRRYKRIGLCARLTGKCQRNDTNSIDRNCDQALGIFCQPRTQKKGVLYIIHMKDQSPLLTAPCTKKSLTCRYDI